MDTERIAFQGTQAQAEAIDRLAVQACMTRSAFVRTVMADALGLPKATRQEVSQGRPRYPVKPDSCCTGFVEGLAPRDRAIMRAVSANVPGIQIAADLNMEYRDVMVAIGRIADALARANAEGA